MSILALVVVCASWIGFAAPLRAEENAATIECTYSTKDSNPNRAELQPRGKRAYKIGDTIYVCKSALRELAFSKKGLAVVFTHEGPLYVKSDGSAVVSIIFDSDIDRFLHGLARYKDGEKIGFIDERGNIVIKAAYQWAYPFNKKGYAVVIWNGGKKEFERRKPDGEPPHGWFSGGIWGCIDKRGNVIIPKCSGEELKIKMDRMGLGGIGNPLDG